MKTKTFIICVLIIYSTLSCDKNKEVETILTCYDETKGIDPWLKAQTDNELLINITNYLTSDSINVIKVAIINDGTFEMCKAAYCKTGRRIKAEINIKDLEKIKKLMFYECN